MSFVNIPIGRTQDTTDFRFGTVPERSSLDSFPSPINQSLGFLTNARIVANYNVAMMKDNLTDSLTKGHYLFTVKENLPGKSSTSLLNLPLLNYLLAVLQKKNSENVKDEEAVYNYVNPLGVLISEDSEWKTQHRRNKYMKSNQVVVGVSGLVTDVINIWGDKIRTCTKLYFKIEKHKDPTFKLTKHSSPTTVKGTCFQIVPRASYQDNTLEAGTGWYVGKAAIGSHSYDNSEQTFSNVDKINSCSKIECFLDF